MGAGFGMLAFAGMLRTSMLEAANGLVSAAGAPAAGAALRAARARNVIFLFMNGGVSQVDTFDPKPALEQYDGQPMPTGTIETERRTGALMKSPFTFKRYGESGHRGERALSRTWAVAPTTSASSAPCTRTSPITSRRCS